MQGSSVIFVLVPDLCDALPPLIMHVPMICCNKYPHTQGALLIAQTPFELQQPLHTYKYVLR
jgi:hypothetical protein